MTDDHALAEHLKEFAEHMEGGVFWLVEREPKPEMLYVSKSYETVWGRKCEWLYENPTDWMEAIHPDERVKIDDKYFHESMKQEAQLTYRIIRPDGSVRYIHDRSFPIRNEHGNIMRVAGIALDITEFWHRNKELSQAKEEIVDLTTKLHAQALEMAELKLALLDMQKKLQPQDQKSEA